MCDLRPNFILIGAQKSASTFIQNCLTEHPSLYLPIGETPYFETPDYENAEQPPWNELFLGREESQLGIKRPNYIGKAEVPHRIESDLPEAKLIAVLRNPVDRAAAAYFHLIKYGFLPAMPIEKGMRLILHSEEFRHHHPRAQEILEFGLYYKYLSRFRHFFARGQILILLHEEIIQNPLRAVQRSYRFLGVRDTFSPASLNSKPQKVIYSIERLRFLTLRNRFLYKYNEERSRLVQRSPGILGYVIASTITATDRLLLARLLPAEKVKLSPPLRNELVKYYREDISALESLIERDLTTWSQISA